MLTCHEVSDRASRYLDAALPMRERLGMRLHLMMCRHCRRYVDQMAATMALLRQLPDEPGQNATMDSLATTLAKARQARDGSSL